MTVGGLLWARAFCINLCPPASDRRWWWHIFWQSWQYDKRLTSITGPRTRFVTLTFDKIIIIEGGGAFSIGYPLMRYRNWSRFCCWWCGIDDVHSENFWSTVHVPIALDSNENTHTHERRKQSKVCQGLVGREALTMLLWPLEHDPLSAPWSRIFGGVRKGRVVGRYVVPT